MCNEKMPSIFGAIERERLKFLNYGDQFRCWRQGLCKERFAYV
jgi:hypothetical protein